MELVLSNSNRRHDFTREFMRTLMDKQTVSMAVAFYNDKGRFLNELVKNGGTIRLIVRLGFPTDPYSLKRALEFAPKVHVKFFTAKSFHPKLYVFGNDAAIVGSSNFTDSGLMSNQEVNVVIPSEDPRFEELQEIFEYYWAQAQTLDEDVLQKYAEAIKELEDASKRVDAIIAKSLPDVGCSDTMVADKKTKLDSDIARETHLYREFLHHFAHLRQIYVELGQRKVDESRLPLRLEIDQFLNWTFENYASQTYAKAPVRMGDDLTTNVRKWIESYFDSPSNTSETVADTHYGALINGFGSPSKIASLDLDSLTELLTRVFAFEGYVSRYQKIEQFRQNLLDAIKNTLTYLLFGEGIGVERVIRCLHAPYKLRHVGENTLKELYGWVNQENVPIYNQRVRKSMRWLGHDI